MVTSRRWTMADLLDVTEDDNRYEIIDGELLVSTQPNLEHQLVCGHLHAELRAWNLRTGHGIAVLAPGVIFADDSAVAPDVAWLSRARYSLAAGVDGKLHQAPELVIEVMSPGNENLCRDHELKLGLYARQGVEEYWIVDWPTRTIHVHRRTADALVLVTSLTSSDVLQTPLLPGFTVVVAQLFGTGTP